MTNGPFEVGQVLRLQQVSTGMDCFDHLQNAVGIVRSVAIDSDGDECIELLIGDRVVLLYTHQIAVQLLGKVAAGAAMSASHDLPPVPTAEPVAAPVLAPAAHPSAPSVGVR